jgi:hypothetical protein
MATTRLVARSDAGRAVPRLGMSSSCTDCPLVDRPEAPRWALAMAMVTEWQAR